MIATHCQQTFGWTTHIREFTRTFVTFCECFQLQAEFSEILRFSKLNASFAPPEASANRRINQQSNSQADLGWPWSQSETRRHDIDSNWMQLMMQFVQRHAIHVITTTTTNQASHSNTEHIAPHLLSKIRVLVQWLNSEEAWRRQGWKRQKSQVPKESERIQKSRLRVVWLCDCQAEPSLFAP
jgi:hypothetical protein